MPGPPRRPIPLAIIPRAPAWLPIRVPLSIVILPHPIALAGVPPHPDLPHVVVPPVVALFVTHLSILWIAALLRWCFFAGHLHTLVNVFVANVPRKGISADLRTGRAIMRRSWL